MIKTQKENGSAHAIVIVILILVIIGILGFVFWKNFLDKKSTVTKTNTSIVSKPISKSIIKSATTQPAVDSTADWKTTTSPLTGYTIKYPSDWILSQGAETGEQIMTNVNGGKGFNTTIVSARTDGTPNKLPTIRYMCVTVDDYTGKWGYEAQPSVSSFMNISSFQPNASTRLNIATVPNISNPGISILNQMYATTSSGGIQIPLTGGGQLTITASFDCVQGDYDALQSSKDIFLKQPETQTAENIIKSLSF